ncbi:uncharacterized protein LY89DRAFT_672147 [Mollisia scopiformis]|uniref:Uncharacterized protein n=1 Tax=Mollisia scopiformis TaxID=149040 RepID=A0A194X107_MOLSC|nr:uncharacterized protein LY89DRAFT_672147 [Mollisia scopiformis]KUJ13875.1 hypothetical protein LY89DRAFT_672147 [Mollisia scopiformis]
MRSHHAHAPWRKSVLIPFWSIQLLVGLLDLALLGLAVGVIVNWDNNDGYCADGIDCNFNEVSTGAKIIVPIWMAMLLICLVLTIAEIILLARHKLKPKTFVIFNTIKSTIWTVLFVLDIVSFVDNNSRTVSFVGLIIEAVLWLCFIIPLIYGSVIYHRTRRDGYSSVIDPNANPSNVDGVPEYPAIQTPYTGYSAKAYAAPDIEAQPGSERRASYNHERDTRFEAFRSSSYGNESYLPYAQEVHGDIGYRGTVPTGGLSSGRGSPEIPQVYVQHHDGETFEMESNSRRDLR